MRQSVQSSKRPRLGFIDLARAIAILLMLEGHFVGLTLADEWRNSDGVIYSLWNHLRGLAAPMFFTVTGLIFAYLLRGAGEPGYWKSRRVRRGLKRAAELVIWGYVLQLNASMFSWVLEYGPTQRMGAFHVLQCIAVGLVVIMVVQGLAGRLGRPALATIYAVGGFSLFATSILLANHDGFIPANAPRGIQNMIQGPVGPFPLAPWLGYTLYGGAIGVALQSRERVGLGMILGFLTVGFLLASFGWAFDHAFGGQWLALTGHASADPALPNFFHGRFGEILFLLGVLMAVEKYVAAVPEWLSTIGRNTFPIYIVHVVVLYGGIFGIGIHDVWTHKLNPWESAFGALVFCTLFGWIVQWTGPATLRWRDWRLAGSTS